MAIGTVNPKGTQTPQKPLGRVVLDMHRNTIVIAGKTMTFSKAQHGSLKTILSNLLSASDEFDTFNIPVYEKYDPNENNQKVQDALNNLQNPK